MLRSINVPKCLFLWARMAVAAIKSLAPRLPGVLRRSSCRVRFKAFSMICLSQQERQKARRGTDDRH